MKADSILATIGNTPHIRLARLFPDHEVWVKAERANPGGSIKDRIGLAMIESLAIYALVIELILLFANPSLKHLGF